MRPALTAAAEHVLAPAAPERLSVEVGPAGLVLGRDRAGAPVRLRLFRPEPTRVTFVGGAWAARVLVFRCLALGARVAVRAADPPRWTALDTMAGGRGDRVWPIPGEHGAVPVPGGQAAAPDGQGAVPSAQAADTQPVLHLYDLGPAGPEAGPGRVPLGPWQAQLTVLNQLGVSGAQSLAESDVVLLQRLAEPEAALAVGGLNLSPEAVPLLQALTDDMVVVVGGGADQYTWVAATSVERQLFGEPVR